MKHIKDICNKLYHSSCFYRHPISDFEKILGNDIVKTLVSKGYLKNSPKIEAIGDHDYKEPCYEFGKLFRLIFNYHTTSFWQFIKYYIIFDTIETIKETMKK